MHFGGDFIAQKLHNDPQNSQAGSHNWTPNPDPDGPGTGVLLEP